jgi:mannan endo-1,4-beta-mannosidase
MAWNCATAIEPADKDLIPEARALLTYLESIYGKKTLAGISGTKNAEAIRQECGKEAAIVAIDLSGWNSPTWGKTYTPVVQGYVNSAKDCRAQGGIVTMQFHWKHPMKPDGSAWVGKHGNNPPSGPFDMAAAARPGTPERKAFMDDLAKHADYLQQLADARVPVLWRPFHEIDGGWFWWTDKEHPENTAEMWRAMFRYLVDERKLHNLIWVYSAGLHPSAKGKDVTQIEYRKRFYPGDAYVDISGIDIYPNDYYGWGKPQEDAYQKAFDIMAQVTPGKMLALCESEAIPDPDRMAAGGPKWLYCLPWWGPGKAHSADWIRKTYNHEFVITRDELPDVRTCPPATTGVGPMDQAAVRQPVGP